MIFKGFKGMETDFEGILKRSEGILGGFKGFQGISRYLQGS